MFIRTITTKDGREIPIIIADYDDFLVPPRYDMDTNKYKECYKEIRELSKNCKCKFIINGKSYQ